MNGGMNERSAHLKLAFLCEKVMASWGKKSCFTCPGEMAQSLRYLLHRHGDQRYHSTKKICVVAQACHPTVGEADRVG